MEIPEPPEKFNWRELKAFLNTLREANLTNRIIAGRNISLGTPSSDGTPINANDCDPCP